MSRRLIVNADDFGFTRDVNAGIVEARRRGILRATTLMANGAAFDDAVRLARENPDLDVGCHLVLVGGSSLSRPAQRLPTSLSELVCRLAMDWRRPAIEAELAAQIERLLAAGIEPTHLDAHKHTHLAPPVLDVVLKLARRYSITWVRRPFDLPLTAAAASAPRRRRLVQRALRPLDQGFERKLAAAGLRATDAFAGFQMTGLYGVAELAALIRELPEGVTEFMCHPGRCTAELLAAPTRLTESRQQELEALTSDEVRQAVAETGVKLCGFGNA